MVGLVPWHGAGWAVPLAGTAIASALCKLASIGTISTSASRREVLFIARYVPVIFMRSSSGRRCRISSGSLS